MNVLVRLRKGLVKAWSVAFGRQAALSARDGVREALGVIRHNRELTEEALREIGHLRGRMDRLEEASARAFERLESLTLQTRKPPTPIYDNVLAMETRAGLSICIDGRDAGEGAALLAQGRIDPGVDRLIAKFMRPGGVFVDVGAHFGYYSLLAALLGGPQGRVYAIEANPYLAPLISRSARANNFSDRIRINACAASDRAAKAGFGFDPFASGRGSLSEGRAKGGVEVERARLDDLIETDLVADVVKLDVGGHELAALRGMTDLLRRSPDIRLILRYAPALHDGEGPAVDLVDELAAMGLSVWRVTRDGFLADVLREDLLRGDPLRLVAARRRPGDREIRWEGAALARDSGRWLARGPEWPLGPGRYEAVVEGDVGGEVELMAVRESGMQIASRRTSRPGEPLGFELFDDARRVSIGVRAVSDAPRFRADRIVLRDLS